MNNVIVTGAARRIGAATVRAFHARGDRVVVHYRTSKADAEALAAELNAVRGESAVAIAESGDDPQRFVAEACAFFGAARIDVLVLNGSQFAPAAGVEAVTRGEFERLFASNVAAPFFLVQAALPALRAAAAPCVIGLVDVVTHGAEFAVYAASKAALLSMIRSMAAEFAPHIRVNAVSPGVILWPENDPAFDTEAALADVPLNRRGESADVADAVLYLAAARYVTGQNLAVCGGLALRRPQ
jgi:pteridine reductase